MLTDSIYFRFLTEQGFETVSDYGTIIDIQKIMKRASEVSKSYINQ